MDLEAHPGGFLVQALDPAKHDVELAIAEGIGPAGIGGTSLVLKIVWHHPLRFIEALFDLGAPLPLGGMKGVGRRSIATIIREAGDAIDSNVGDRWLAGLRGVGRAYADARR
jgi:hypothetical protein